MNSNRTLAAPRRNPGDGDPSGEHLFSALAGDVVAFTEAEGTGVEFERVALTPEQIVIDRLPTAPPKATGRRSFSGAATAQAEALPPGVLAAVRNSSSS
ncbi:hypothetical protein [Actinacidiphila acididurans]|uniref:Uncharacterized protein n=1 Tax=Actinacidiphila acididurans TaxID=2784346 RepID=A0ABS2TKQ4_9ACTN|nr:hypothetical protein [Actinacidiphila acididurans]MBM9503081.1 hypothetical protein [Actinacidiphila acididurans]